MIRFGMRSSDPPAGKLGKDRLLPVSDCRTPSASLCRERDRLLGIAGRPSLLRIGQRLDDCCARYNFAAVCQSSGCGRQKFNRHGRGPRIHDLRHTFAVRTLLNWYRTGKDPSREMIQLTTYLGHTEPAPYLLVYRGRSRTARTGFDGQRR